MSALLGQMDLFFDGDQTIFSHPVDHLVHAGPADTEPVGDPGLDDGDLELFDLPDRLGVLSITSVFHQGPGIVNEACDDAGVGG